MEQIIKAILNVKNKDGSILDAMHAVQKIQGYMNAEAIKEIADTFGLEPSKVYETASFYSMIRFSQAGRNLIQICRNAPCHVAGAAKTIAAFEEAIGISMGETTKDENYTLEYMECIGQCQASPSVMINGKIYSHVTSDKVQEILAELK